MKTSRFITHLSTVVLTATAAICIASPPAESAASCINTGEGCAVGMTGPGGGIIFYDAGSTQWWGRFLEAETSTRVATQPIGPLATPVNTPGDTAADRQTMAIGMGRINTARLRASNSPLATSVNSGDWFIPSKDELDALYDYWKLNSTGFKYGAVPVWTSSESEDLFYWYQLFHDGTQFTDANGIIAGLKSNLTATKSQKHSGSGFLAAQMYVVLVRAFPQTDQNPPAPSLVTAVTSNVSCQSSSFNCQIGDQGPGGGIIVYDAGSNKSWGRYLEIAPKSCEVSRVAYSKGSTDDIFYSDAELLLSKALGTGRSNTSRLRIILAPAAMATATACNGLSDWFLPSKGELNEAFRQLSHSRIGLQLTPIGQFERGYYWTSSDYNGKTAWTQYFADGQQFDRVQTLTGNMKPPARPFYVRPMRAFAEGAATSVQPPPSPPQTAPPTRRPRPRPRLRPSPPLTSNK